MNCDKALLKATSIILQQDKYPKDKLLALYTFIYQTALWQGTSKIKATSRYIASGLGWTTSTVTKYKKALTELGLIHTFKRTDNRGRVEGWYIEIVYKPIDNNKPNEKIQELTKKQTQSSKNIEKSQLHPDVFSTTSGQKPHLVEKDTNALYKNINAYTENKNKYISHNHVSVSTKDTPQNLTKENSNFEEKENPPSNNKTETLTREKSRGFKTKKSKKKTLEEVRTAYLSDPKKVVDLWNSIVATKTKRPISYDQLTSKELRYLRAMCKQFTEEDWINYFETLKKSEVLFKLKSGWLPNLAWALKFDTHKKVTRGDYLPEDGVINGFKKSTVEMLEMAAEWLSEEQKSQSILDIVREDPELNKKCEEMLSWL